MATDDDAKLFVHERSDYRAPSSVLIDSDDYQRQCAEMERLRTRLAATHAALAVYHESIQALYAAVPAEAQFRVEIQLQALEQRLREVSNGD